MNILYDPEKTQTDKYQFKINSGGELRIDTYSDYHPVTIIFINGKFSEVQYDFKGRKLYTRSDWYVLEGIAAKIKEIEATYKSK